MKSSTLISFMVFIIVNSCFCITIHVPGDYSTIQAAIDASTHWDTVLVADGTFTGGGNRDIDFNGKAITVKSENGAEFTIIDCENNGRGFSFCSGEDDRSKLEGFTIQNGYVNGSYPENCGGGIYCDYFSSPAIAKCMIISNSATRGGGIYCYDSSPPIMKCTITSDLINS